MRVLAPGLDPDVTHVQHFHGVKNPGGSNGNSVTPTAAQDNDGDGFIELGEGAATYGPIILSLQDDTVDGLAGFPTAPGGEIVIHGAFTNFAAVNELPGLGGGMVIDRRPWLSGRVAAVSQRLKPAALRFETKKGPADFDGA